LIQINDRHRKAAQTHPAKAQSRRHAMKSIIVHIHDDSGLEGRLAVALDLCRAHDAHLTCLHMTPYGAYAAFDPAGGMFTSGILLETLQKQ
jgi:hypothetical protein